MSIQLPAHLTGLRRATSLAGHLAKNFQTSALPPHISIRDQRFRMVDGTGEERDVPTYDPDLGPYFDCIVFDLSDHKVRTFYPPESVYIPGQDTPPTCFSDNGVAPSSRAAIPQAKCCTPDPTGVNGCKWAVWGSKISKMSGKGIPACAESIKFAVIAVDCLYDDAGNVNDMEPTEGVPLMMLKVPPKSMENAAAYGKILEDNGVELPMTVTRVSFESQGVIRFNAVSLVTEAMVEHIQRAIGSKTGDVLVGRDDKPYVGAIAGPNGAAQIAAGAPAAAPPAMAPPAALAAPQPQPSAFAPPPTQTAPSQEARPRGRPRKAAAPPATAPQQPAFMSGAQGTGAQGAGIPAPATAPTPPFMQPHGQPQPMANTGGPPQQMGMVTNAPGPTSDLQRALNDAFALPTR